MVFSPVMKQTWQIAAVNIMFRSFFATLRLHRISFHCVCLQTAGCIGMLRAISHNTNTLFYENNYVRTDVFKKTFFFLFHTIDKCLYLLSSPLTISLVARMKNRWEMKRKIAIWSLTWDLTSRFNSDSAAFMRAIVSTFLGDVTMVAYSI